MIHTESVMGATAVNQPARSRTRRHRLRTAVYILIALCLLVAGGMAGTGWYFSSQALQPVHDRVTYPLKVVAVRGSTVEVAQRDGSSITTSDDIARSATYRLQWQGGAITLGRVIASSAHGVVRQFTGSVQGLKAGTSVHLDIFMYASPGALRLSYRTIALPDPLGAMPAWYVPGTSSTWAIYVHGRGMSRTEGLRSMSTLAAYGFPILDISYRNDLGAPSSSDHVYHFGATEWQDVQAAARFALSHGARRLVLYGYSLGGSLVESFLHRSPDAGRVRAAILDSPALDWNAILDFRAGQQNVPGIITAIGKRFVAWRLGLGSLDDTNRLLPRVDFKVPTLLFQGTADTSVPYDRNITLARAQPRMVTLVVVPGAEHTQGWNTSPRLYTAMLRTFISKRILNG
ncbi:MAG TPA: prolyl oligopeptidase family serine peptidase [Chloroflexota bacterium]|nr:prolyl oligopeptidase family serine peptidase [Chloroflexota bacterium]